MDDGQLQRQLGQLFIVGFDGLTADDNIKTLIRAPYYIGGVVLSRRNIATTDQVVALVHDLQRTAKDAGHARPLFICASQDNGLGSTIEPPVAPSLPDLTSVRATGSAGVAYRVASATGRLLGTLGINMNFTDVCNITSKASKAAEAERALSGDELGHLSAATLKGLRSEGIVPCIKSFTGCDYTCRDSQVAIPADSKSKKMLETHDLIPYRRAFAQNVEAVMIPHVVVPCLDDSLPVSFSRRAVNILREKLQYKGLMISDCLDPEASAANGAVASFLAGNHCIIMSDTFTAQIEAFRRVLDACDAGEIPLDQILKSFALVNRLKDQFLDWESMLKIHPVNELNLDFQADTLLLETGKPELCTGPSQIPIEPFDPSEDMTQLIKLWHSLLPQYAVPAYRLSDLLTRPNGAHFRVRRGPTLIGFVATYLNEDRPTTYISALLVDPAHQSQGIGTALIRHAQAYLRTASTARTVTIGSSFPRFWPGVPLDIPTHCQSFFTNRGFCNAPGPTARDYFVDLAKYEAPSAALERAAAAGVTFMPWRKDQYDECMTRQKEMFGGDDVWIGAYERLATSEQYHQAMVAVDTSGKQVGWTLMLEPGIGLISDLAFPPLLGEKTGQIGCVGVHSDARNKGVGLALVAHAAVDLKRRGMERIFVDWVTLVNWYEKTGFEVWREYRTMTLNELD
ncbi:hypothetical protein AJ79_05295 [Helicocarpus griseus UAMH5409]|uniref:N-acetyltransferase domain-containing protein n=1 Tax=Helicocarpus griseus UAMH5409 TaxID=1447875 RepID=A0A2B7XG53_9EURO|nr:hypothetical protein AJ79_05295 [Helicocarpus griseus UAMH5409]